MTLREWLDQPGLHFKEMKERYYVRKYLRRHFPKLSKNQIKHLVGQYTWKSFMNEISRGL